MLSIVLIHLGICVSFQVRSQILVPQIGVTFSGSSLESTDVSSHETDVSMRPGLLAGLGVEFPIDQRLSIQSGVLFVQKGGRSDHLAYDGSLALINKFNVLLQYLDLPLHTKFSLNKNSNFKFYGSMGVNVSYLIGGRYNIFFSYDDPSGGPPYQASGTEEIVFDGMDFMVPIGNKDVTCRFDLGLFVGVSVLVKNRVTFDLSYTFGLGKVEFFYDTLASNRVIQMTVGVPLKLSR